MICELLHLWVERRPNPQERSGAPHRNKSSKWNVSLRRALMQVSSQGSIELFRVETDVSVSIQPHAAVLIPLSQLAREAPTARHVHEVEESTLQYGHEARGEGVDELLRKGCTRFESWR